MILESFDYAEEDFHVRQVIEARNEADTILAAVEKAPKHPAWQQLTAEERSEIARLDRELTAVKQSDDLPSIRQATEALDKATRRFAELMMDQAVSSALSGETMTSASEAWAGAPTAHT